jgi:phosphohistidine phosphatase
MHRYLYLLRHAESAEKMDGQHDKERELTQRGIREAMLIGKYLYKEKSSLDTMLCSIAIRAMATANIIADAMSFGTGKIIAQEALYDASTRTFFQYVTHIDDKYNSVLCIAHNPSISYLAESFTRAEIGNMPPAGLAIIKFNVTSWKEVMQGNGELQDYIYPKMLLDE